MTAGSADREDHNTSPSRGAVLFGMTHDEVIEFNDRVVADFRAHDGVMPDGHVFHGNPTLLMTSVGARSGRRITTPLTYTPDGDAFIVFASAGGSPTAPAWAFNLRANPDVELEVLGEAFSARAVESAGDERQRLFDLMVANLPRFGDYQDAVERTIPVFRIERT